MDILARLAQPYEGMNFAMLPPDPIEAIKFRMKQNGLAINDLEPMIGKTNRVYEVLNRRRPLTLAMISRLNKGLGISAELLITEALHTTMNAFPLALEAMPIYGLLNLRT